MKLKSCSLLLKAAAISAPLILLNVRAAEQPADADPAPPEAARETEASEAEPPEDAGESEPQVQEPAPPEEMADPPEEVDEPAQPEEPADPAPPVAEEKAEEKAAGEDAPGRGKAGERESSGRPGKAEDAGRGNRPERPERPDRPAGADREDMPPARGRGEGRGNRPDRAERQSPPPSEPEKQAEEQVREATREVERELNRRKDKIRGKDEAQAVIDEVIGTESRISRAEATRGERARTRFQRDDQRRGDRRSADISNEQRREAVEYFRRRLRGEAPEVEPPVFLRRGDGRREPRVVERTEIIEERRDYYQPRYFNEGRRYVHFDSRAAIPAILLAAEALNRVNVRPAREVAPMFFERQNVPQAALPPENYRDEDAWVVSYPVSEKSMITSDAILFQQGSTEFADAYSYEIVSALADAMKDLPAEERFVIEGHASAEGDWESNMTLSQQRAERIVREMVRRGVSPYRLVPVGYGESEARHPADAAESLREQDRRVVVYKLGDEPVASR